MSKNPLAAIRTAHVLCTHSATHGDRVTLRANCSCGVVLQWRDREAEHAAHVDDVAIAHFAAKEHAAWQEGAAEALEAAAGSLGLPGLFGQPAAHESSLQAHLRRLAAEYRDEADR